MTDVRPPRSADSRAHWWSHGDAERFLELVGPAMDMAGMEARIVGSVATAGSSAEGLDLSVTPKPGVERTFEDVRRLVEEALATVLGRPDVSGPHEAVHDENSFFFDMALRDGRFVEIHASTEDFPLPDVPTP